MASQTIGQGFSNFVATTTQIPSNLPGSVQPASSSQSIRWQIQAGTGADKGNQVYSATIAFTGSPEVIDLKSLTDFYNNTFALARVRSVVIKNLATTDSFTLLFGYSSTTANAWTAAVSNPGQITIEPSSANNDGLLILTAPNTTGYAVGSSSHLLQLDPGANSFSAIVTIVGVDT